MRQRRWASDITRLTPNAGLDLKSRAARYSRVTHSRGTRISDGANRASNNYMEAARGMRAFARLLARGQYPGRVGIIKTLPDISSNRHLKNYAFATSPRQTGCPHWHVISTDPFKPSQWALQNFSFSGGMQEQAGLPHFFVSLMGSPISSFLVCF
jgi:hypothetical protein